MSRPESDDAPVLHISKRRKDLTHGGIAGHLVRMSIPMVWGILAIISFQLVDLYFISKLGHDALTAVSFTLPVTMFIHYVLIGLSIGMSSVVSRLLGQGHHDTVARVTTHGLCFTVLFGIALAGLGIAVLDPLFAALGASPAMMPMIRDFMVPWLAGGVFLSLPMVGNAALRGSGDTFFPAFVMILAAIINAALDPLLIFGLYGFPRLEIAGAAISTIFGNACAAVAGLVVLYRKGLIAVRPFHADRFGDSLKRILHVGVPASVTNMILPIAQGIVTALMALHGAQAVAAFGIVQRVEALAFVVLMAVATGMAPIIGQNWGAHKYDRVHTTLNLALGFCVGWSALMAVLLGAFARPLARAFTDDPATVDLAAQYFWIVPASFVVGNLVPGWSSAFNAMGMPKRSFLMIVVRILALTVPLTVLGNHFGGPLGIFVGLAVANVLSGAGFHVLNLRACRLREMHEAHSAPLR
jgi:putative MATE family efflux protein